MEDFDDPLPGSQDDAGDFVHYPVSEHLSRQAAEDKERAIWGETPEEDPIAS